MGATGSTLDYTYNYNGSESTISMISTPNGNSIATPICYLFNENTQEEVTNENNLIYTFTPSGDTIYTFTLKLAHYCCGTCLNFNPDQNSRIQIAPPYTSYTVLLDKGANSRSLSLFRINENRSQRIRAREFRRLGRGTALSAPFLEWNTERDANFNEASAMDTFSKVVCDASGTAYVAHIFEDKVDGVVLGNGLSIAKLDGSGNAIHVNRLSVNDLTNIPLGPISITATSVSVTAARDKIYVVVNKAVPDGAAIAFLEVDPATLAITVRMHQGLETFGATYSPPVIAAVPGSNNVYVAASLSGNTRILIQAAPIAPYNILIEPEDGYAYITEPVIACDASGSVYIAYEALPLDGLRKIVVEKYDTPMSGFTMVRAWRYDGPYLNSINYNAAPVIGIDTIGNCYIAHETNTTLDISDASQNGFTDITITKITRDGAPVWAKQNSTFNTTHSNKMPSLYVDAAGNSYVAFQVYSLINPSIQRVDVVKFDTDGNTVWLTTRLGDIADAGNFAIDPCIALDGQSHAYVSFTALSEDNDPQKTDIIVSRLVESSTGLNLTVSVGGVPEITDITQFFSTISRWGTSLYSDIVFYAGQQGYTFNITDYQITSVRTTARAITQFDFVITTLSQDQAQHAADYINMNYASLIQSLQEAIVADFAEYAGLIIQLESINGAPPAPLNSIPLRVNPYRASGNTIVYTKEFVEALATGDTLPVPGRVPWSIVPLTAGALMRPLGRSIGIYTADAMLRYRFEQIQLINGLATEGVAASGDGNWFCGYICVWAADGVAPVYP